MRVDLLMQLTIKKGIIDIELRNGLVANRSHRKKNTNSGHVSHRSKHLVIVTTTLLLKTTSHKTSLISLKRTI